MRTRLGRHFVLAATLALVSGLGEDALAASPAGVQREGFLIGLSVGAGGIRYPSGATFNCTYTYYPTFRQECTRTDMDYSTKPGFAVGFRIGSMVSKRVALMLDGTGMSTSADGEVLASGVDTAAIQYWVTEKAWIKAGAGIGVMSDEGDTESGLGLMAAVGTELKQRGRYAMDLSARFATVGLDSGRVSQFSLQLGFNWY